jgi:hypothetical protein
MNPSATLSMQARSLASMSFRVCRVLGIDHTPRESDAERIGRFGICESENRFIDSLAQ